MSDNKKDLILRAVHTFWEGALASLIVTLPGVIENIQNGWDVVRPLLISAGIGALAAGFSALKTGVIVPWLDKRKGEREKDNGNNT